MKISKFELGTKFYTFISEDEFRIKYLVKKNEDSGIFMDEESFETETITESVLNDKYTLMIGYRQDILIQYSLKDNYSFLKVPSYDWEILYESSGYKWINNDKNNKKFVICDYYINNYYKDSHNVTNFFGFNIYKYNKKSVFKNMMKHIVNLNKISNFNEKDIDYIWHKYFMHEVNNNEVIDYEQFSNIVNLGDVADGKAKIPDVVLDDTEEILNTSIRCYDVYELDPSIDLEKVNMKHYIAYDHNVDKYYLILYVIDEFRDSIKTRQNLEDHIDLVNFMLK